MSSTFRPVLLEQLRHGEHRADAHLVGLAAGDGVAAEDEQRREAERLCAVARHHQRGRRAVGQLRRVAGRDAALAALVSNDRRQLRRALRASCRAGCTRRDRRSASSSPTFSPVFLSSTARRTCIGASSSLKNPSCCALAIRCWLTSEYSSCASRRDAVALRHDFGRVAHGHVERRARARATHGLGELSRSIIVIDSTPPPMAASTPSCSTMCAACTIACSPELQKRLTVTPAVVTGKPARSARDARDVVAGGAVRLAAAEDDLLDLRRDRAPATLPSTWRIACAARSSGRVMLNEPRSDLASGVRELATMTASLTAAIVTRRRYLRLGLALLIAKCKLLIGLFNCLQSAVSPEPES